MHPHFIVGAILHGTAIAILAFFVLFAASKAEGLIRLLGTVLGIWVLVLAFLAIVAGSMFGFPGMDRMHYGWMQQWQQTAQPAAPAPSPPKK